MNKRQKEVQQSMLQEEQEYIRRLKETYRQASRDCENKIRELSARNDLENIQSIVYQKQYQQILKMQIDEALMDLQSSEYRGMNEYLENCYMNGAVGAFYDMHGQGVPVLFPIDQSQVAKAVKLDSKISVGLYTRLGEDVLKLKENIRNEISRGIANGSTWNQTASNLAMGMRSPLNKSYNNAVRIARTEGHRIQNQAQMDTLNKAKSKGADVVKQWDSTLDDDTRDTHKQLDGQIREIDQPFEVNGKTAMQPGGFGEPAEDCNCRCCMLQRAKWALDESELRELESRAEYFGLDKAESFEDFKNKYLKLPVNAATMEIVKDCQLLKSVMSAADYNAFMDLIRNNNNNGVRILYNRYADKLNGVTLAQSGAYNPRNNTVQFRYQRPGEIAKGRSKFSTLAHEYGHAFDATATFANTTYKEVDALNSSVKIGTMQFFRKVPSSSDAFLEAMRKDRDTLNKLLSTSPDTKKDLFSTWASAGVQDAIDGMLGQKSGMQWGHGDSYYDRTYSAIKNLGKSKDLKSAYKSLGLDASNQAKVKSICRNYETTSELWANISSAVVCGGKELDYIKKYLPNSYNAYLEILKEVQ